MSRSRKRKKAAKPPFPRKQWLPGQAPRVEPPAKGKGSYDRGRAGRAVRKEVEEDLGEG